LQIYLRSNRKRGTLVGQILTLIIAFHVLLCHKNFALYLLACLTLDVSSIILIKQLIVNMSLFKDMRIELLNFFIYEPLHVLLLQVRSFKVLVEDAINVWVVFFNILMVLFEVRMFESLFSCDSFIWVKLNQLREQI
jgi:hypothetical protein